MGRDGLSKQRAKDFASGREIVMVISRLAFCRQKIFIWLANCFSLFSQPARLIGGQITLQDCLMALYYNYNGSLKCSIMKELGKTQQ